MNLSSKMRFSKFSNKIQSFSVKVYRKSEQKSQSNKKMNFIFNRICVTKYTFPFI